MTLYVLAAMVAATYAAGMGYMCRGAFCEQYEDPPGYFDRLFSWAWGLFDRPAPDEEVVAASTAALTATPLYTLLTRPGAASVIDRATVDLRGLLAAMKDRT